MATETPMQLGMVGLGRMGANLVRRLMRDGHDCVVYDINPDAIKELAGEGAEGAASLEEMASRLKAPRSVWVMVPAGEITEKTVQGVAEVLEKGDAIIDGGNSYYRDDIRRAAEVGEPRDGALGDLPAGTMTQTARGGSSACTSSWGEAAAVIPSVASAAPASALTSVPTQV